MQRPHQQWHWLFECGSRGLNVGNMTTLQQTLLKVAILLRFGIEKLQKCIFYFLRVTLCVLNNAKPTKQTVLFNFTFGQDVRQDLFAVGKEEKSPFCVLLDVIG